MRSISRFATAMFLICAMAGIPNTGFARDRQTDWCEGKGGPSPDTRIGACTALLRKYRNNKKNLAIIHNLRGNAYLQKKQLEDAIRDYTQSIHLNPQNSSAYFNRSLAYRQSKLLEPALKDMDAAVQLSPSSQHYSVRAFLKLSLGRSEEAIEDYNKAEALGATTANLFYNRSLAYFKIGKLPESLGDANRALQIDPSASHYARRAEVNRRLGKSDDALSDYSAAIDKGTESGWVFFGRAEMLIGKRRYEAAIKDLDRSIGMMPDEAAFFQQRALAYNSLNRSAAAIQDASEAVRLKANGTSYWIRSIVYRSAEKFELALQDIAKAIEQEPGTSNYYASRGITYETMGQYDHSMQDFETALRLNPSNHSAVRGKIALYQDLSRNKEALELLEILSKQGPLNPESLAARCYSRTEIGQAKEAIPDCDSALAAIKVNPNTLLERGKAHWLLNQLADADKDFLEAENIFTERLKSAKTYKNYIGRAVARMRQKKVDMSIEDLNAAIAIDGKRAIAFVNRGTAFSRKGDLYKAISDYDKALAIEPKSVWLLSNRCSAFYKLRNYSKALESCSFALQVNPKYAEALNLRGKIKRAQGDEAGAIADEAAAKNLNPYVGKNP